nr:envelope precursor [Bovine leukemia virus]
MPKERRSRRRPQPIIRWVSLTLTLLALCQPIQTWRCSLSLGNQQWMTTYNQEAKFFISIDHILEAHNQSPFCPRSPRYTLDFVNGYPKIYWPPPQGRRRFGARAMVTYDCEPRCPYVGADHFDCPHWDNASQADQGSFYVNHQTLFLHLKQCHGIFTLTWEIWGYDPLITFSLHKIPDPPQPDFPQLNSDWVPSVRSWALLLNQTARAFPDCAICWEPSPPWAPEILVYNKTISSSGPGLALPDAQIFWVNTSLFNTTQGWHHPSQRLLFNVSQGNALLLPPISLVNLSTASSAPPTRVRRSPVAALTLGLALSVGLTGINVAVSALSHQRLTSLIHVLEQDQQRLITAINQTHYNLLNVASVVAQNRRGLDWLYIRLGFQSLCPTINEPCCFLRIQNDSIIRLGDLQPLSQRVSTDWQWPWNWDLGLTAWVRETIHSVLSLFLLALFLLFLAPCLIKCLTSRLLKLLRQAPHFPEISFPPKPDSDYQALLPSAPEIYSHLSPTKPDYINLRPCP